MDDVIEWLLGGDVSVVYQVHRDLLGHDRPDIKARIATEGWGARLLAARKPDGHWGRGFYFPKWTSTHYTLLDLANLDCPTTPEISASLGRVLEEINEGRPFGKAVYTDTCINGMVLTYASHFGATQDQLAPIVDFLIADQMPDGAFNCMRARSGASHSSLHSTLSVLEGFAAYRAAGHGYRGAELDALAVKARAFILLHRFFRSDHTGKVIRPDFLSFPVSPRWFYNILRALDYFAGIEAPYDPNMDDALDALRAKCRPDGRWNANAAKSGEVHFVMEQAGKPSRLVTLRTLRVLAKYGKAGS